METMTLKELETVKHYLNTHLENQKEGWEETSKEEVESLETIIAKLKLNIIMRKIGVAQ